MAAFGKMVPTESQIQEGRLRFPPEGQLLPTSTPGGLPSLCPVSLGLPLP
jgi:hypothetical protein